MTSTDSSTMQMKYNPAYCLNEHLEYFEASVAGHLSADFDEIFGGLLNDFPEDAPLPCISPLPMQMPSLQSPCLKPHTISPSSSSVSIIKSYSAPVPASHVTPPASPKYNEQVVCPNPFLNMDMNMKREQAVVSPTTVVSTATPTPTAVPSSSATVAVAPAKKSRKRQVSDVVSSSEATTTAPRRKNAKKIDPNDKEDVRRERNRQHAKRSRQRKREFLNALEQSVQELKAENEQLFAIMGLSSEEGRQTVLQRQTELANVANEGFIAALSQPQNRVLGDDALASLRELF